MLTKKDEHIVTVTSTEELEQIDRRKFCYAASKIVRTYPEDFINEDTGETVTIDRNEILYSKGDHISQDDFSALLFHFQSGELKEVSLSDQYRPGYVFGSSWSIWQVNAAGHIKLNMLLSAPNANLAYEIAKDYIELNYSGGFKITGIKLFTANIVIENNTEEKENNGKKVENNWYSISSVVKEDTEEDEEVEVENRAYDFIVYADTVETAKEIIEEWVAKRRIENKQTEPYVVNILSAKTINCNTIVPEDFWMAYKEDSEGGQS
jgi:hypothetical protein